MTSPAAPIQAAIYCRISDDRAGAGLGVERQRTDCVQLAASLGWAILDTYTDNDAPAADGRRRPEYQRMLADIEAGRITGLIIWHFDRLNRTPRELEPLLDLLDRHRISVQSVTAGVIDLSTPSGRAVARTLGAWARFESEHKAERVRAQMLQSARTGAIHGGGTRPYGYQQDKLTIIPAEAAVIRQTMRRLLAGEHLAVLFRDLNRRGIPTSQGNRWCSNTLAEILTSSRIAGWRQAPSTRHRNGPRFGSPFLVRAQWPAIVSRRDVERAREIMRNQTLYPPGQAGWLLSGILRCDACGRTMAGRIGTHTSHCYVCPTNQRVAILKCGHLSITGTVDQDVTNRIATAIHDGLVARILDAGAAAYSATHEALQATDRRLLDVGRDRDAGRITHREWKIRRSWIVRTAQRDEALAADIPNRAALLELPTMQSEFTEHWNQLPMRQRRGLTHGLIADIRVVSGVPIRYGYQPERVKITWRA